MRVAKAAAWLDAAGYAKNLAKDWAIGPKEVDLILL
jgi:hypothetical protein